VTRLPQLCPVGQSRGQCQRLCPGLRVPRTRHSRSVEYQVIWFPARRLYARASPIRPWVTINACVHLIRADERIAAGWVAPHRRGVPQPARQDCHH
jgi:hypothetical protein